MADDHKKVHFQHGSSPSRDSHSPEKTNLPPILAQYGLVDKTETKHVGHNKKKKKHKKSSFQETEERRSPSPKQRSSHLYEDIRPQRDSYYADLVENLPDRVEQQRKDIQRRSEELERKIREREEKKKQESKRKLERHELSHDNSFLQAIPKSDYYKIVLVEEKLRSDGKLRTQSDMNQFWDDIRRPGVLDFKYNALIHHKTSQKSSDKGSSGESDVAGGRSRTSSWVSQSSVSDKPPPNLPEQFRPMTGIAETRESSRPTTRDQQTHRNSSPQKEYSSVPSSRLRNDPAYIARQAAAELDRQYPQQHMPELSCMNMDFGEQPPPPDEIFKEIEMTRQQKERSLFLKRLKKMYNMSQSHMAAAKRIQDQHEEQKQFSLDNPALSDLIALDEYLGHGAEEAECDPSSQDPYKSRPWMKYVRRRTMVPIWEESEDALTDTSGRTPSKGSRKSSGTVKSRGSSGGTHRQEPGPKPLPLTMVAVKEGSTIKEAKCLSTLWTNYMKDVPAQS